MGITGGSDVSDCVHYGVGLPSFLGKLEELRGMSPNVQIRGGMITMIVSAKYLTGCRLMCMT